MLSLTAALFLGVVAFTNYRFCKSVLYPPFVFTAWWAFLLLATAASYNQFYPLSPDTVGIFLAGAVMFTVGGAVAARACTQMRTKVRSTQYSPRALDVILTLGLVALAALFPWYYRYAVELAQQVSGGDFWLGRRLAELQAADEFVTLDTLTPVGSLLPNLVVAAASLALIAYLEAGEGRFARFRAYAYIAVATAYSVLTAASGGLLLFVQVAAVALMAGRRLTWRTLLVVTVACGSIFSGNGILLRKGELFRAVSLADTVRGAFELIQLYLVGPLIAFDRSPLESWGYRPWDMWRSFLVIAVKLGYRVDVPPLHLHYTSVSPTQVINTYTMYYAYYPSYGLAGVIIITLFLGAVLTGLYVRAAQGSRVAVIMNAFMVGGILMSGFAEQFLMATYHLLKILIIVYAIYRIAGLWRGRGATGSRREPAFVMKDPAAWPVSTSAGTPAGTAGRYRSQVRG